MRDAVVNFRQVAALGWPAVPPKRDGMSDPRKRKRSKPVHRGSLASPESIGGIVAGKGVDFQTRYAVCQLPGWLETGSFHQLFLRGLAILMFDSTTPMDHSGLTFR